MGKLSPGSHIPIIDHKYFKEEFPDYAVLFAWNHADEIVKKEHCCDFNNHKKVITIINKFQKKRPKVSLDQITFLGFPFKRWILNYQKCVTKYSKVIRLN